LSENEPTKQIFIAKKLYKLTNNPEDLKLYLALLNNAGNFEETSGYLGTDVETICYYQIAESLYNLKKFQDAKNILEKQANLSESEELLLAKICYEIDENNSLKLFETKFASSKNKEVIKFAIKLSYELMDYSKTIELSEKIQPISSTEILYMVGQAYLFKNKFSKAKKIFNRLCEIDNSPKAQFALALAYIGVKQTSLAIETVQTNSDYLKLVTFILNEKSISKTTLAREFLAVKTIFEKDSLALFKILDICIKRNDLKTTNELLPLMNNIQNLRKEYYNIKNLILNENFSEAETRLTNRNNKAFKMLHAELLDAQNRFEELESLLKETTDYEEYEYEQCCYYFARIFEGKKDFSRAIDVALKGLDYIDNLAEQYYTLLFRLYKQIGEPRIALDCLEKAATYNPDLRPQVVKEAALL